MFITPANIDRLADLTRLHLQDEERVELVEYMNAQISQLQQLLTVKTDGVESLISVLQDQATPLRSDQIRPSLSQEEALANAPDRFGEFFKVPPMIGADSDD